MSICPPTATPAHAQQSPFYLRPFDKLMAPLVASWCRNPQELFWLAPKTPPPLTAAKVVAWPGPNGQAFLFYRERVFEPLGYLELNPMPGEPGHLWIGHCVVPPESRGRGIGRHMVELILDEAFLFRNADRVSLVAFPDNQSAIRCYRSAGFLDEGEQLRSFPTTGREHVMRLMSIEARRHARLKS